MSYREIKIFAQLYRDITGICFFYFRVYLSLLTGPYSILFAQNGNQFYTEFSDWSSIVEEVSPPPKKKDTTTISTEKKIKGNDSDLALEIWRDTQGRFSCSLV